MSNLWLEGLTDDNRAVCIYVNRRDIIRLEESDAQSTLVFLTGSRVIRVTQPYGALRDLFCSPYVGSGEFDTVLAKTYPIGIAK